MHLWLRHGWKTHYSLLQNKERLNQLKKQAYIHLTEWFVGIKSLNRANMPTQQTMHASICCEALL